jgi:hypothetical protein
VRRALAPFASRAGRFSRSLCAAAVAYGALSVGLQLGAEGWVLLAQLLVGYAGLFWVRFLERGGELQDVAPGRSALFCLVVGTLATLMAFPAPGALLVNAFRWPVALGMVAGVAGALGGRRAAVVAAGGVEWFGGRIAGVTGDGRGQVLRGLLVTVLVVATVVGSLGELWGDDSYLRSWW